MMRISIGNGQDTLFWKDLWLGDPPLQVRFPVLYALETVKNCTVSDRISEFEIS